MVMITDFTDASNQAMFNYINTDYRR